MEKPEGIRTWRLGVTFFIGLIFSYLFFESFLVSNGHNGTPPKAVVYLVPLAWFAIVATYCYGPVVRYYLSRSRKG